MAETPPKTEMTQLQTFVFATGLIFGWPLLIAVNILVWKVALGL